MTETNDVPGPKLVIEGPLTLTQDGQKSQVQRLVISPTLDGITLDFDQSSASPLDFDPRKPWSFVGGARVEYWNDNNNKCDLRLILSRSRGPQGQGVEVNFNTNQISVVVSLPSALEPATAGASIIRIATQFDAFQTVDVSVANARFKKACERLRSGKSGPGSADALVASLGDSSSVWKHTGCTFTIAGNKARWQYDNLTRNGPTKASRLCSAGNGGVRFSLDVDGDKTLSFRDSALSLVVTAEWDSPERVLAPNTFAEVTLEAAWNMPWDLGENGPHAAAAVAPSLNQLLVAANQLAAGSRNSLAVAMGAQPESFLPTLDSISGSGRMPAVLFYKRRLEMMPDGEILLPQKDLGDRAVISILSSFGEQSPSPPSPSVVAHIKLPGIGMEGSFAVELEHDPNALQAEASTGDVIASFRLRRPAAPTSSPPSWSTRLGALGFSSFGQHVLADDPKDGSSMSRLLITTPRDRVVSAGADQLAVGVEWHLRLDVGSVTPEGIDRPWGDRDDRRLPLIVPQRLESRPIDSPGPSAPAEPRLPPPAGPQSPAANDQVQPPFVLVVDESAGPAQDRWLRATLLENSADAGDPAAVSTLLSFEPWSVLRFTRRRLDRLGDAENAAVGVYDGDQRVWRLKQAGPEYAFEFPVQGIGESADKPGMLEIHDLSHETEQLLKDDVVRSKNDLIVLRPAPGRDKDVIERRYVLETRFGPSLELWVKPSDLDRNYILPEWQAHEIFRRRNDFGLGVALQALRGEFVYGLSVGVDVTRESGPAALARVAEIEALTGRLPPLLLNPTPSVRQTAMIERWRRLRRALLRRSERIEVWTPAYDQIRPFVQARFEKGATFALRTTALHRRPVEAEQGADESTGKTTSGALRFAPHGLPGGALWPVESSSILEALVGSPTSTAGTVERVAIGPGGGDADQSVEFAGGQVKIASQTRAGFLQRQRIEVLGRIGVFWHRAKHVIVYERTVNPSEQFAPVADTTEWNKTRSRRAILRKVSEYIEILQPTRSYPDVGPNTGTECGFLDSVRFNTRIIHVDGSWKTELKTDDGEKPLGYKIPLWNAGAAEQRPNVYPLPSVTAVTLGEGKEKRPLVPRQLANPENLFFFTQTNDPDKADPKPANTDPGPCDPDTWEPVFGVDYANLADPAALERLVAPGGSGYGADSKDDAFAKGRKPSTPRVLPGHHRFTWRLLPDGKRTMLNAGLDGTPVYGDLDSITFSRGSANASDDTAWALAAVVNPSLILKEIDRIRAVTDDAFKKQKTSLTARVKTLCDHITQASKVVPLLVQSPLDCDTLKQGLVDKAVSQKRRLIQAIFHDWGLSASRWTDEDIKSAAKHHDNDLTEAISDLLGVRQVVDGLFDDVQTGAGSILADIAAIRRAVADCVAELRKSLMRATARVEAALEAADRDVKATAAWWPRVYKDTRLLVQSICAALKGEVAAETNEMLHRIGLESTPLAQKVVNLLQEALTECATGITEAVNTLSSKLPNPDTPPLTEVKKDFFVDTCHDAISKIRAAVDVLETKLLRCLDEPLVSNDAVTPIEKLRHGIAQFIVSERVLTPACAGITFADSPETIEKIRSKVSQQFTVFASDIDAWAKKTVDAWNTLVDSPNPPSFVAGACDAAHALADSLLPADELTRIKQALLPPLIPQTIDSLSTLISAASAPNEFLQALTVKKNAVVSWRDNAETNKTLAAAYTARVSEALANMGGRPNPGKTLTLISAATQAPEIGQMEVNIDRMRCSYKQAKIETSKAMASFSKLGAALKALGIELPFNGLGDQLSLDSLESDFVSFRKTFDLQRLLPDFGGIKLDGLLDGVQLPETPEKFRDAVKLRHEFDKVHFRAWAQIDVNLPIAGRKKLFGIGPMVMYLRDSQLTGNVRAEASKDSADASTTGSGLIETNIDVDISGQLVVSLEQVRIEYSKENKLHVDFDPRRIRLQPTMQFVQDTFGDLLGDEIGGLTILKEQGIPVGLEHQFKLPVLSLMAGTSGISNIQMSNAFRILAYPDFVVANRFCLSRPELPFIFSFFILGGTGYVIVDAQYRPLDKTLTVEVEAAIGGAAMIGIAASAVSGQVFITLSVALTYRKTVSGAGAAGDGLAVAAVLVIAGNVNIAGIVDVYIGVLLRLTYREGGAIDGVGTVTVVVKISVFFTFKFRAEMTLTMRGGRAETTKNISAEADSPAAKAAQANIESANRLAGTRQQT